MIAASDKPIFPWKVLVNCFPNLTILLIVRRDVVIICPIIPEDDTCRTSIGSLLCPTVTPIISPFDRCIMGNRHFQKLKMGCKIESKRTVLIIFSSRGKNYERLGRVARVMSVSRFLRVRISVGEGSYVTLPVPKQSRDAQFLHGRKIYGEEKLPYESAEFLHTHTRAKAANSSPPFNFFFASIADWDRRCCTALTCSCLFPELWSCVVPSRGKMKKRPRRLISRFPLSNHSRTTLMNNLVLTLL